MIVHEDCRYFKGDIPCRPHKEEGVHCNNCSFYDPVKEHILIIKLGAIGDVIRTTPILHKLKEVYPKAMVHWLTHTPDILPDQIDKAYRFVPEHIDVLKQIHFDWLYNLDKDREACALANVVQAKKKKGFILKNGYPYPLDEAAKQKWITGLFDDANKKNTKSYLEEIFEICGFRFNGEEYILNAKQEQVWNLPKDKKIIGLNTGCGPRWKSRLWPESHWIALSELLMKNGYEVLFLGGKREDIKNKRLAEKTGGQYLGHFSLQVFIDLMNQCNLVVTAVTMALHIALGLKKKVVLFNNIFNAHEFELYNRGIIIEPPKECKGCFMNDCEKTCMELILPKDVFGKVKKLLKS
jgi:ADP-heptose:LPS heptosyltransferase